ncbi:DUF2642 domain-containing protein [Brevibacillus invocatus]|uniref:DUF2642 domain-containing protein n=1 Tax=Brevibacillus invocatus TaxID=173959 RepID=A0A3M8CCC0_9BACL|nr:DUF2642 domain-containing protein [Brevibacillus invocatus]RNB73392.1 DUF2642 domain-containing protein [Brevibacillus invocatus]
MAHISPVQHLPFPGTPLFLKLTAGIGSMISLQTVQGEIEGTLTGVESGFVTVRIDENTELHVVFSTVISFSFY